MSKKMVIDQNNFPIGFYDTDIHTIIPAGAIDITEAQWIEFINNQGQKVWNISTLSIDNYIIPSNFDLGIFKLQSSNDIDRVAESSRLKYITDGVGQSLTYQEKADEASDYLVAGSPVDLSPYPFIQAEVNATGKDSTISCNDILAAQALWISKGSSIEELRLKAKIDISNATTKAEIDSIVALAIDSLNLV